MYFRSPHAFKKCTVILFFFTSSSLCYFNGFPARSTCTKMCKMLKFKYTYNIRIKIILPERTRKSASTITSTAILFTLFKFPPQKTDRNKRTPDEIIGSVPRFRDCVLLHGSPSSELPPIYFHFFRLIKSILYFWSGVA